jgi:hypothetical protein
MTRSLFMQNLEATRSLFAAVNAFRAAPRGLVTVRDADGTYRVTNPSASPDAVWCVSQRDGRDFGASRLIKVERIYPATMTPAEW